MNMLTRLMTLLVVTEITAIGLLLLCGWSLDCVQPEHRSAEGFFTYRLGPLCADLPFWYVATLILMALNGVLCMRAALIDGRIGSPEEGPWGGFSINLSYIRLVGMNMLLSPMIIAAFLVLRSLHL